MTRVKFLTKAGLQFGATGLLRGATRDVLAGTNKSGKKILKRG